MRTLRDEAMQRCPLRARQGQPSPRRMLAHSNLLYATAAALTWYGLDGQHHATLAGAEHPSKSIFHSRIHQDGKAKCKGKPVMQDATREALTTRSSPTAVMIQKEQTCEKSPSMSSVIKPVHSRHSMPHLEECCLSGHPHWGGQGRGACGGASGPPQR